MSHFFGFIRGMRQMRHKKAVFLGHRRVPKSVPQKADTLCLFFNVYSLDSDLIINSIEKKIKLNLIFKINVIFLDLYNFLNRYRKFIG